MSEEKIYSIIDDIAHDAKVIIREHLHPETDDLIVGGFRQSAKMWEEVAEEVRKVLLNLSETLSSVVFDDGEREADEYNIGDDVYFIYNGMAHHGNVRYVTHLTGGTELLITESNMCIVADDAFRSMDELVEHLKEHVHG